MYSSRNNLLWKMLPSFLSKTFNDKSMRLSVLIFSQNSNYTYILIFIFYLSVFDSNEFISNNDSDKERVSRDKRAEKHTYFKKIRIICLTRKENYLKS